MSSHQPARGRGAAFNPPNRFDQFHVEPIDVDYLQHEEKPPTPTIFYRDQSKSILSKNDSPDIPFTYSINPYRGCEHGCVYCYARPSHEYLGFSSGTDFESKILVKMDAARLLDEAFRGKRWQPQMVCLSGNTDCYQPVERKLQLTRQCLEVFLKYRNPIGIITKNFLVARDIDILRQLAKLDLVQVTISVTTLDKELARRMEPRTSTPDKRLEAIELLASNNIPVDVNVAPIIPGLNDEEIPSILQEVAKKGARSAWYTMVRLPGGVKQLFIDWLEREMKDRARKILGRIRDSHGGELEDTRWGIRFRGEGEIAKAVKSLFQISCDKNGLNKNTFSFNTTHFRIPTDNQLRMFG